MAFVAACPFCADSRTSFRVPDSALGASLPCPKCGNHFTAVPVERKATQAATVVSAANDAAAPAPSANRSAVSAPSAPLVVAAAGGLDAEAAAASPGGRVNVWGLAALALAAVGWAVAGLGLARWPAIVLALAGLGVVATGVLVLPPRAGRRGWLGLGSGACLLLLALASWKPSWLNPRWAIDVAVPGTNPQQFLLIGRDDKEVIKVLGPEERANAAQAIRQGDVVIEIDSVRVMPPSWKKTSSGHLPAVKLCIALHISNVGYLHRVPCQMAGEGKEPVVVDDSGRAYSLSPSTEEPRTLLPGQALDVVLVFDPPPAGVAHLDLDLPAAALGSAGTFRFRIPTALIRLDRK